MAGLRHVGGQHSTRRGRLARKQAVVRPASGIHRCVGDRRQRRGVVREGMAVQRAYGYSTMVDAGQTMLARLGLAAGGTLWGAQLCCC